MYAQVEKKKENKSMVVAVTQKKKNGVQLLGFEHNRPESIAQRKLREMMNNSSQMQATQLQTIAGTDSIRINENYAGLPNNLKSGLVVSTLDGSKTPDQNTAVQRVTAPEFIPGNYAGANGIAVAGGAGQSSALDNWLNGNVGLVGVARGGFAPGAGQIAIIPADGILWNGVALNQIFNFAALRREIAAGVLGEQLTAGGVAPAGLAEPEQTQTHHIVEFGAAHAAISRQILAWVGININSSVNGVHLPSVDRDDGGDASIHLGSHTNKYGDLVRDRLIAAVNINRQPLHAPAPVTPATIGGYLAAAASVAADHVAIVAALNQLRNDLLAGDIELNINTDMEWDD